MTLVFDAGGSHRVSAVVMCCLEQFQASPQSLLDCVFICAMVKNGEILEGLTV